MDPYRRISRLLSGSFLRWWRELVAAAIVLASRLYAMPRSPWELDEPQFALSIIEFDPTKYHPHPPGCPLYLGLGKVLTLVVHDPWQSLLLVSIIASACGVVALMAAFRRFLGDEDLAFAGAVIFYLSAGMLVHTDIAMADATALLFIALFLYATTFLPEEANDRRALAVGLWAAAAIAARPQTAIPMLPAFAVALWYLRTWRWKTIAVATFAFASLMAFLPLVEGTGGIPQFIEYQRKQAEYFVAHDAQQSRGATGFAYIVIRFVAHPWGSKYVTIPFFLCVVLGLGSFVRRFDRRFVPLAVFCAVHLLFALAAMDPADAVRYSLPAMIGLALIAAFGFGFLRQVTQMRAAPWIATLVFVALSWTYARPVLEARRKALSPPAAAAQYANEKFQPNTVILYDLALHPHADYLLPRFIRMPIDAGLKKYYDRPDVPLVQYVDGGSRSAEATVFAWPDSDAYRKLTRNFYRQTTLDPVRPAERYLPLSGVYALERGAGGLEWRWLAKESAVRLPRAHTSALDLEFTLSPDAPYEANRVRVRINAQEAAVVSVPRGQSATVTVALPPTPDVTVSMSAEQAFAPATVLRNKDPRILAVQLTRFEQK